MTKGELIKYLEPFTDEIEIEITPEYVLNAYDIGRIINTKEY